MRSSPAKAATSMNKVERGRWKLVCNRSTTRNWKPGVMKMSVSPVQALIGPSRATVSSRRSAVVPMLTTRLAEAIASAVARDGPIKAWTGETDIFITPGFRFRAVDLLLTNFHLPRSTLFMLVAAFAGLERMKAAYAHAVAARYRFYSYGDCCLLHR